MKNLNFLLLSLLLVAAFGLASNAAAAAQEQIKLRAIFKVESLSCGSCEARVKKALSADAGVAAVEVNLESKTVTVDFRKGVTDEKIIAGTITKAGYPATFIAFSSVDKPLKSDLSRKGGCDGGCCGKTSG